MSKETERLQREITQKAEQLANARLKEKLQTQMINARKRKTENEVKKKQLSALFRQADAHRKIELGAWSSLRGRTNLTLPNSAGCC